jgi:hypothetical protein
MVRAATVIATYRGPGGSGSTVAQLGYSYVHLDDGYHDCNHDINGSFHAANGTLLVDSWKFPRGVAATNAKIHALDLTSGSYLNNWACSERGKLATGWSLQVGSEAVASLGYDGGGPDGDIFALHKALASAAKTVGRSNPSYVNNCRNSAQNTDPNTDSTS